MKKLILATILVSSFQFQISSFAADIETSGFIDARYGTRTQSDPNEGDTTLQELRFQYGGVWYHDLFTLTARSDFVFDSVANNHDHIDLETGEGPIDLRELNILFTPVPWADVKFGRQILTWGTGDLLFINDLFSKDWKSFFAGRDEEYLKAPSDALFVSFFPSWATIDVAYMPRFDADRFIDGERFSYWGGMGLTGDDLQTDRPDEWFKDDEVALRISRYIKGWKISAYGYKGFWKTPQGVDPLTGESIFPRLAVYGSSVRGTLGGGIANLEMGYYDSLDDQNGENPFIRNSEIRLLAGYEHELARNLSAAIQYYLEHKMDYDEYSTSYIGPSGTEADENRHLITLRLTQRLLNQNLTLGLFSFWSPSDRDGYLRPEVSYKLNDEWLLTMRGNIFFGEDKDTFFGQFEQDSNIAIGMRYNF